MTDQRFIIGVLGVQGDIEENVSQSRAALKSLGKKGEVRVVRQSGDVLGLNGLILPGGESTVTSRLATIHGDLFHKITDVISRGMPVLGICAGMILLSTRAHDRVVGQTTQRLMSLLNIEVERNAFGRQKESFESNMEIPLVGKRSFKGVFIRAPIVSEMEDRVEAIAKIDGKIVAVKQGNIVATAFHPELASDNRFHVNLIRSASNTRIQIP
jgi:pyridoxal 5'-phosphate synthase pdxT subunit